MIQTDTLLGRLNQLEVNSSIPVENRQEKVHDWSKVRVVEQAAIIVYAHILRLIMQTSFTSIVTTERIPDSLLELL